MAPCFEIRIWLVTGFLVACTACSESRLKRESGKPVAERIADRDFPSVFQAWNRADNLHEDPVKTLGRHDLLFHGPSFYGLVWNKESEGLADGFLAESIHQGLKKRSELLTENPNMILLLEIRYRDAHPSYLPEGHEWWMTDSAGNPVYGWREGGFLRLELRNDAFRANVADKAVAAIKSGVIDGIMLDWWNEGEFPEARLDILSRIREQVPQDALILVNANHRKVPRSAPLVNGLFMECYTSSDSADWEQIRTTLVWAETNLREPRINCVEAWFDHSRDDLYKMRAVTTLALTHSEGYVLFSDPNSLPAPDHLHNWYSFWDAKLGFPESGTLQTEAGYFLRYFTCGVAVYNPLGNEDIRIGFQEELISVSTGKKAISHTLNSYDGDIYVYDKR
jgi:hypothetical protein